MQFSFQTLCNLYCFFMFSVFYFNKWGGLGHHSSINYDVTKSYFRISCLIHFQLSTWSWPSGWCIGLRSWLRGFDAQLGHLHDACTSLLQKPKLQLSGLKFLILSL